MEGKMMSMIVTRAPGWEPPKKTAPIARERRGHQDEVAETVEFGAADEASAQDGAALATAPQQTNA
jgi:hypothetical protein